MAPSWSGWAGAAATLIVGFVPPLVDKLSSEPSKQSTTGESFIQIYLQSWRDGAKQIVGIQPAKNDSTTIGQQSDQKPEPQTGSSYIDNLIRATPGGASFDKYKFAQAGITIENISGQDLLLAVEYRGVRAISNLGGSSECGLDGLKSINGLPQEPDPLQFSRLAPGAKASISITNCQGITAKDKAKSLSVNIPLITINNEKTKQFTVALNDITIIQ